MTLSFQHVYCERIEMGHEAQKIFCIIVSRNRFKDLKEDVSS